MCCSEFIAKYVLFLANLVFAIAGITVLGLGVAVLVQVREIQEILPINIIPISLIVLGAVIFLIAFLACCGAIKESRCMLIMYSVCMIVLAGLKIYLSVVIFDFLTAIQDTVNRWLTSAFNQTSLRQAFHVLESLFRCCGTTGPSSYGGEPLPPSCCANPIDNTCNAPTAHDGCTTLVTNYLETFSEAVGSVLIVIIVVEVVLIILACFFSRRIYDRAQGNSKALIS